MTKIFKVTKKENEYLFEAVHAMKENILFQYDWSESYTDDGDLVEIKLSKHDQKRMDDLQKLLLKIARV